MTHIHFKEHIVRKSDDTSTIYPDNDFLITSNHIGDDNKNIRFYNQSVKSPGGDYWSFQKNYTDTSFSPPVEVYPDRYFIGASEVAVEWNLEKQRFAFTFLHTPIIYGGNTSVGMIPIGYKGHTTAIPNVCMYNRRSGVFFTEMKPASLWETAMGFNITPNTTGTMIVTFESNGDLNDNLDDTLGRKTTGGFISLTNAMKNAAKTNTGDENDMVATFIQDINYTATEDT